MRTAKNALSLRLFGIMALAILIGFTMAGCKDGSDLIDTSDLTPTVDDFDIIGLDTEYEEGDTITVSITAKPGKTKGAVTV